MSEWMIYLWTRLDGIWNMAIFGSVFLGIVSAILTVAYFVHAIDEEYNAKELKILRKLFPLVPMIWCVFLLVAIFVPTSKEFAMIKVIPKLANSEISQQIQKDMPEIYTMAKDALKEMIAPKKTGIK